MSHAAVPVVNMAPIIEGLLGGMFVETCAAFILYGITTLQAYIYWWTFPEDVKIARVTVGVVWVLESLHTAFCIHLLYYYLVANFGNLVGVSEIIWSAGATIAVEVFISAIVQGFFVRRIWILSHKSLLTTIVPAVLLSVRVCLSFSTSVISWTTTSWATFEANKAVYYAAILGLVFAAATDLVIAVILIYYLQRSRTGFQRTDNVIKSMQTYIINTGALTMVVSVAIVLTFTLDKGSLLFVGLVQLQSKLYANSFLATLNARTHLKDIDKSYSQEPNSLELVSRRQQITDPKRPIEIFQHVSHDVSIADGSFNEIVDVADTAKEKHGKTHSLV